jgi:hypothetical protein
MQEIKLTKGLVALVDDADYGRVMAAGPWQGHPRKKTAYAMRHVWRDGKKTAQYLHRFLLGITDPKILVDHGDRNGLNCQRWNIRPATRSENAANAGKCKGFTSQYRGVYVRSSGRFHARIKVDGKQVYLGSYWHELNAALAYDRAARFFYGAFASCNFPPTPTDRVA